MDLMGEKTRVRELYEKMGLGYIRLYLKESVDGYINLISGVRLRGASVIDVGCGLGIGAGLLSGLVRQYVCVDFACGLLTYPAKLPNVDVLCSDAVMLPIRDSALDIAILLNVVNADIDGEQVIKEAVRVSNLVLAKSPREVDNELIRAQLSSVNTLKRKY